MSAHLAPHTGLVIDEETTRAERVRSVLVDPLGVDDPDALTSAWLDSFSVIEDVDAPQRFVEDALASSLKNWDPDAHRPIREAFAVQAAASLSLPAPSPSMLWSHSTDVLPAAESMIRGESGSEAMLLSSLTYLHPLPALGLYGLDRADLKRMLTYIRERVSMLDLDVSVRSLIQQFTAMSLSGATQTIMLRRDRSEPIEPGSFAHTVVALIEEFISLRTASVSGVPRMGWLPFDAEELIDPTSLVMVDVSQAAKLPAPASSAEWALTQIALDPAQPKVFSLDAIVNLTRSLRSRIAKSMAKNGHQVSDEYAVQTSSPVPEMLTEQPRETTLLDDLAGVIAGTGTVAFSHNVEKIRRSSHTRANRRHPDDTDMPGRTTVTRFKRDIHIYGDCSDSMSDDNQLSMMRVVVALAQSLGINVYFTSFSEILSEDVLLDVHGRVFEDVWEDFLNLPKVSGGTDFSQIWRHIDSDPELRDRISLVVTDFGWKNRAYSVDHPENLYYAPVQVSDRQWPKVREWAEKFIGSMERGAPDIATKIIGMIR